MFILRKSLQLAGRIRASEMCDNDPTFKNQELLKYINGNGDIRHYNSMPGPQLTPSWKGIQNHGHLHWRGDTNNRAVVDDQGVIETPDGYRNDIERCFDKENPIDYDEVLSLRNLTTAHRGFNGNVSPRVTSDDMEAFGKFMFELMQPPNPIRALDNSLTPSEKRGRDYFFGTTNTEKPDEVVHNSAGAPPLIGADDPQPFMEGEPVGFTCNDCHRVSPEHGFYGTDGNAAVSGEIQTMKTAQLRNMYDKVGMFGLPDREGYRTYPGGNAHQGDQVRGFGFQNNGAMDTLYNYLHGEVFASDKYKKVGFKTEQQRRDVEAFMLAFENDLAPIVGQQMTLGAGLATPEAIARVRLFEERALKPWNAKEAGGSMAIPVTECDLVAEGVIGDKAERFIFSTVKKEYRLLGANQWFTLDQLVDKAMQGTNSLTFTSVPPGAGMRRLNH